MIWWRCQLINLGTGLLPFLYFNYYAPGAPVIAVAGLWAILNVLGLALAVSRAFNVHRERHRSLPVLFGRPYG
jgi:hypothetical protein